jgi:hypothetical protein
MSAPGLTALDAPAQATLRFAAGASAAFVFTEAMQWTPNFLGAVLAAVLLANLPGRPPLKLGVVLVLVMAVSALLVFMASALLNGMPHVLFGLVGLCMLFAFFAIASGKSMLPFLLLLVCLAIIPVVAMISPSVAGPLAKSLARSMLVAMLAVWAAYAVWPRALPPAPAPVAQPLAASPLTLALLSTAVVLPLSLAYMLFGWTDSLPVLLGTVMMVMTFDVTRGRKQAAGMILGNLGGGMLGVVLYGVFQTTPSLPFLALLLFLALVPFGRIAAARDASAGVAVIACNGMLIIFGSALGSNAPLSSWIVRVLQFALAGAFAVGMLQIAWYFAFGPRGATARR